MMEKIPEYNRREFLTTSAILAGGLLIPFHSFAGKRERNNASLDTLKPNAYLRIGTDGQVTVLLSRCEVGQGIWTSLPMLIAEELDADWTKVRAEHAPAAVEYYHTVYATQRTGGSTSISSEFERYRKAGATARHLLVQAAASRAKVDFAECITENGQVIAGGMKIDYGDLVNDAAKLKPPAEVPLKTPAHWKIIGKSKKRLDTPDKSNGKAIFGIDVREPDALTAVIARVPLEGSVIKSYDKEKALSIPGVKQVVEIPQGVAVLGDNFWVARRGRDALNVQWDLKENAKIDSRSLLADYKKRADQGGIVATEKGDVDAALKTSAKILSVEYFQPYIAHAPMEPLNATVRLTKDKCEVWTGTQTQTDDQNAAAEITGLPISKVFIHTMFLGGSFGRRNITRSDFVREAVEIAKATGKVVKTVWTREDDIAGGRYRPAFLHRFKVGLGKDGLPVAWKQISVGQSVMTGGPFEKVAVINGVDQYSIEGMQQAAHVNALVNKKIELNTPVLPVTVDNWRAVGLSHTIFAMESLSDEMAYAAGKDPLDYRIALYKEEPRLVHVLKVLKEKSDWGKKLPKGQGMGVAAFKGMGSFAALIFKVTVNPKGLVKVSKATCVVDCGIAVNPDGVLAQVESSVGHGLSAALYSEVTYKAGLVDQRNFHDYKSLRMNEMPLVETHIIPSEEKPGGIGEAAAGQVMPALTNAIFAATGNRIRTLPVYRKS
ncbi:xanthine dehydrogenase family protein molybdopterin-binding subunit [Dyadobacter sp. CY351]|uniref:xanthine dehydrogenase family protein molybdopterin-binding subunit n=1 Tax=Dyadobacter sp. CY351 TaxID=2909337 RepID=UPI001F2FB6AE|nr:xanthine dehydrogenase family protein molybdopterin-binding subunit [Dyadobacter sp. CY351]MCF2518788.1 xanthine dehydrogenase family protein molybdopterin-binding subunit [Dyadobacter sp. CY351]